MTDRELARIRARWVLDGEHGPELVRIPYGPNKAWRSGARPLTQTQQLAVDLMALLAEVERLRAVTEAGRVEVLYQVDKASRAMDMLRELVAAADASYVDIHPFAGPGHSKIVGPFQDAVDKARALLAHRQRVQEEASNA